MARRLVLLASVVLFAASGRAWAATLRGPGRRAPRRATSSSWAAAPWWRAFSRGLSLPSAGPSAWRDAWRRTSSPSAETSSWRRERRSVETSSPSGERSARPAGPARPVVGRVLTVGQLEAAFAAELQTSPLAARPASGLLLAFRLVLLLLWLVIGLLLVRFVPRPVAAAAGFLPGRLATMAALGTAGVLSSLLVSAFLLLVLPAMAGLVVTALLLAILAAAKAFGLAAVFVAVGRRLARGATRGSPLFGDPAALALGLALLGLLSLVPVAGPLVWAVASLLGIGAALVAAARRAALRPAF